MQETGCSGMTFFYFVSSLMKNFCVKTGFSSNRMKLNLPVFPKCLLIVAELHHHVSYIISIFSLS